MKPWGLGVLLGQAFLVLMVIAGCSSSHNLKTDGRNALGGGFSDQEIRQGLYQLTAIGNLAPWPSFSAAIGTWRGRADELCGKDAYQEIIIESNAGYKGTTPTYISPGRMLDLPKFNTRLSGYLLCNSSGMTREEAINYLDALEATKAQELIANRNKELEELGGRSCISSSIAPAESFFQRGKILSALEDYKSAMSCYMQAQAQAQEQQDSNIYRESCSAIGTMYELGWGVERSLPTAMEWYKKAGL